MKKNVSVWIGSAIAIFTSLLVISTLALKKVRVEACIEFNGRTECRTASGRNEEQALRTAVQAACAVLASGMTDSMECDRTPPKSVRRLN
jgi:hypothetical protein